MALLKKHAVSWTPTATTAFAKLKDAMMSPRVLRLPDFTLTFVVECDASSTSLGVVLMQEGHPIAFLNKALKGQALHLSTYEKELLSLVTAVQHWFQYLLGHTFTVRTDQQAFAIFWTSRWVLSPSSVGSPSCLGMISSSNINAVVTTKLPMPCHASPIRPLPKSTCLCPSFLLQPLPRFQN
jgi:hypothetical protein